MKFTILESPNSSVEVKKLIIKQSKILPLNLNLEVFNGPFLNYFTCFCKFKNISLSEIKNLKSLVYLSPDIKILYLSNNLIKDNNTVTNLFDKNIEVSKESSFWFIFTKDYDLNYKNYEFKVSIHDYLKRKFEMVKIFSLATLSTISFDLLVSTEKEKIFNIKLYNEGDFEEVINNIIITADEIKIHNKEFKKLDKLDTYQLEGDITLYPNNENYYQIISDYTENTNPISLLIDNPNSIKSLIGTGINIVENCQVDIRAEKLEPKKWKLIVNSKNLLCNVSIVIRIQNYKKFIPIIDTHSFVMDKYLYIPFSHLDKLEKQIEFDTEVKEFHIYFSSSNVKNIVKKVFY